MKYVLVLGPLRRDHREALGVCLDQQTAILQASKVESAQKHWGKHGEAIKAIIMFAPCDWAAGFIQGCRVTKTIGVSNSATIQDTLGDCGCCELTSERSMSNCLYSI